MLNITSDKIFKSTVMVLFSEATFTVTPKVLK